MIVVAQDDMDFKQSTFGEMTKSTKDFLTSAWERFDSSSLGHASRKIYEGVQKGIEFAIENDAFRKLRASTRASREFSDPNAFRELDTIAKLQHSPGTMQPFIMANPFARKLYQEGMLDGYSDSYEDVFKGDIGETHVHYRLATEGIIVKDPIDGKYYTTSYADEEMDLHRELDIVEKSMIQRAWDVTNRALKHGGDDPTSIYNSSLGKSWKADLFNIMIEND